MTMRGTFLGSLFILQLIILHAAGDVYDAELDDGWTDPFDMGYGGTSNSDPDVSTIVKKKSSSSHSGEDLRLLRIVKSFVRALRNSKTEEELLNGSNIVWKTEMKLTGYEFQLLDSFTDVSSSSTSLRDVEDALLAAFSSAKSIEGRSLPPKLPNFDFPTYDAEDLMIMFIFGLLLCLALALFTGIISWGKFFIGFIGLCSIWKWIFLRKSKQLEKDIPCEEDQGWIATYLYSSCKKSSTKDYLINSSFEVVPTQALIDTLSEIFFRPLLLFGDHLGKFFNSLWGDNGFFPAMFGYGFVLFFTSITVPSIILGFFYFGLPQRRNNESDINRGRERKRSFDSKRIDVDDDKIKSLENQVKSLNTTISTLREVHLQSMEYNRNRKIEEIKMSRDNARNSSLAIKHNAPILEDNPPYKKLKGIYYSSYEEEPLSNDILIKKDDNLTINESNGASDVERNHDKIASLSSDLILSPPTHFKNSKEREGSTNKEKEFKDEEEVFKEVDEVEDNDDDFEVISKITPPPETEDEEIKKGYD